MTHLPTIINDLAMILLVAGVTTILFKKINQPLVLGYIVAGFITGPHFNFFPTITDKANVHSLPIKPTSTPGRKLVLSFCCSRWDWSSAFTS